MKALEYLRSVRGERTEVQIAEAVGTDPASVGKELIALMNARSHGVIMAQPSDGSARQFVAVFCEEWAPIPDLRPFSSRGLL